MGAKKSVIELRSIQLVQIKESHRQPGRSDGRKKAQRSVTACKALARLYARRKAGIPTGLLRLFAAIPVVTIQVRRRLQGVQPTHKPSGLCPVTFIVGTVLCGLLTSCGILHGSAQIGSDLKPRLGTSISVPLGK